MPKDPTIREMCGLRKTNGDIGVEIEVEGRDLPGETPEAWRAEVDGSLRGGGVEYVLKKPCKYDKVDRHINRMYNHIIKSGGKMRLSPRCGVHIHINVQEWTLNQVMTFIVLYLVVEDLLVRWCGEDREGNIFCLRGRDAEYLYDVLVKVMETQNLNVRDWADNMRYSSMNISALRKYGSLEFRSLRTPEDPQRIKRWIDLLLCVQRASKDFSHPAAVVEGMSNAGGEAFVRMIFGRLAYEVMVPDVEAMLYDGARAVQEIVYTEPRKQDEAPIEADMQRRMAAQWEGMRPRAMHRLDEDARVDLDDLEGEGG